MSEQIALYARVSSDQQAQGGTVESQIASLRQHCVEHGYRVDEDLVFVDNGVSGATLVRPALDRLRDKAVAGEIEKLVILCPDRLARKHAHQLILVEELCRLGVAVEFVNRVLSDSPEDQLLFQIQGVIAEFEREKILERSRRGKLYKARSGKVSVLAGAPYGYIYVRVIDTEDACYKIHQKEADVVRKIFKMYGMERISLGEIARRLNEEGVATRRGRGVWERSSVWGILRNPAYMGKAAYRKTQSVPRNRVTKLARDNSRYPKHVNSSSRDRSESEWIYIPVPRIVGDRVFERCRRQLEENKKLSPRNNKKYEYLLSGLVHCKQCGYSLYGKVASNSRYKRCYYRCMGQDAHRWANGRVCAGHPVRVEVLDDLVWEQTRQLIEQPELTFAEYSRRASTSQDGELSLDGLLAGKARELKRQEAEKQRLLDLYQAGDISLEEIEDRLKAVRGRIKRVEEEIKLLEEEKQQVRRRLQLIEQFGEFKKKITHNLDELSFLQRKELVRLLVKEVIVDSVNEEIVVNHIVPIDESFPLRSRSRDPALRRTAQ